MAGAEQRSTDGQAAAALGVLLAVAVYFVLVELHRPDFVGANDIYGYFMPNMLHAVDSLRDGGKGLLWNPFLSCGQPFFGNSQNGLLYLPHLLFLVLEPNAAVHVVLILNMALGAAGMLLLGRELGLSWVAAFGGALAFELGDPMAQLTSWSPMHDGPWTWVPWALLFCERLLRAPSRRGVIALAVVLAIQLLPGFVLIAAFTYQLIALRVAWELVTRPGERPWRAAGAVAAGLILAPMLVAVQLVPAAEYASKSLRVSASDSIARYAATWIRIPGLTFSQMVAKSALRRPPLPFSVTLLLLAAFAPVARRTRRLASFYVIIGVWFAVLAVGQQTPLFGLYIKLPPGAATLRVPYRFFWISGFCLAALTALALDAVADSGERSVHHWLGVIVAALLAVGLCGVAPGGIRWPEAAALAAIVIALLAATLRPALSRPAAWVMVGAVAINLIGVSLRWPGQLMPSVDAYWSHADTFALLRPSVSPQGRVFIMPDIASQLQFGFMQKTATILRVPGFHDYEALLGRRFAEYFVSMSPGVSRADRDANHTSVGFQRRLFDSAAVRYLIASPSVDSLDGVGLTRVPVSTQELHVYLNDTALPRARYVPRVEVVADPAIVLSRLVHGSDDLSAVAFVEETTPSGFTGVAGTDRPGAARFVTDDPERLVIEVDAPQRGFLVLADQYYPGWRATVSGVEVPILRANYLFRLIEVPAGTSRVEFRYRPTSIAVGGIISALAVVLLALILWRGRDVVRPPAQSRRVAPRAPVG